MPNPKLCTVDMTLISLRSRFAIWNYIAIKYIMISLRRWNLQLSGICRTLVVF